MVRHWKLFVVLGCLGMDSAHAQGELRSLTGGPGDKAGAAMAYLGDATGDGQADLVFGRSGSGWVDVYSPATGQVQARFGWDPAQGAGQSVGGADVDANGRADVIVGLPEASQGFVRFGRVVVHRITDGAILHDLWGANPDDRFGHAVAGVGDLNADGHEDFVVGAPGGPRLGIASGYAKVYSGRDSSQLYHFAAPAFVERFGHSVAAAGDMDLDGVPDIAVGSHSQLLGQIRVFSGATGFPIFHRWSEAPGDGFGFAMAGVGDTNGDGFDDLAVGAPEWPENGDPVGAVSVFSGRDFGSLWTEVGTAVNGQLGFSVAGVGDVNANGYPDLAVGSPGERGGTVRIFEGFSHGDALYTANGTIDDDFGYAVCAAGDANSDGYMDVAVGAPETGIITDEGAIHILECNRYVLDATPEVASFQDTVTLTFRGHPNFFYAYFLESVNGVPFSQLVFTDRFALSGMRVHSLDVGFDLLGVTFVSSFFTRNLDGKLVKSNSERISLLLPN